MNVFVFLFVILTNYVGGQILIDRLYFLAQNCLTPESAAGNCMNFRYCNFIVNLIVQYQQKPDDAILNYLKKSVCGQDGNDPMVRAFFFFKNTTK